MGQISSRQKAIVAAIVLGKRSNRAILEHLEVQGEDVSRVTLVRDLEQLCTLGFLHKDGAGRSVTYQQVRLLGRVIDSIPFPLAVFTLLFIGLGTLLAISQEHVPALIFSALLIVFAPALVFLHERVRFSRGVLWATSVWACLFFFLIFTPAFDTDLPGLGRYRLVDMLSLGTYVFVTMCAWHTVQAIAARRKHPLLPLGLCVLIVMGIHELIDMLHAILLTFFSALPLVFGAYPSSAPLLIAVLVCLIERWWEKVFR